MNISSQKLVRSYLQEIQDRLIPLMGQLNDGVASTLPDVDHWLAFAVSAF